MDLEKLKKEVEKKTGYVYHSSDEQMIGFIKKIVIYHDDYFGYEDENVSIEINFVNGKISVDEEYLTREEQHELTRVVEEII